MDYFYGPSPETLGRTRMLEEEIAGLRAVLAPPLDDPMRGDGNGCLFCGGRWKQPARAQVDHDPACPVLRKDDLLGRS